MSGIRVKYSDQQNLIKVTAASYNFKEFLWTKESLGWLQ